MSKIMTVAFSLIFTALCLGGCVIKDIDDSRKAAIGITPKIMAGYEQKVLEAFKSSDLWKKSGLYFRKVKVDTTKPISYGLRPERKHHSTRYYKIPIISDSEPYLFIKAIHDGLEMKIISEDKVDTKYFVSREDLKNYEAKAFEALKSPAIWEKAGIPYIELQPDSSETHESRYFLLKPESVVNKLGVNIQIVPQFSGDSARMSYEFNLDTGKLLNFGFSEVTIKYPSRVVKSFSGEIEKS